MFQVLPRWPPPRSLLRRGVFCWSVRWPRWGPVSPQNSLPSSRRFRRRTTPGLRPRPPPGDPDLLGTRLGIAARRRRSAATIDPASPLGPGARARRDVVPAPGTGDLLFIPGVPGLLRIPVCPVGAPAPRGGARVHPRTIGATTLLTEIPTITVPATTPRLRDRRPRYRRRLQPPAPGLFRRRPPALLQRRYQRFSQLPVRPLLRRRRRPRRRMRRR